MVRQALGRSAALGGGAKAIAASSLKYPPAQDMAATHQDAPLWPFLVRFARQAVLSLKSVSDPSRHFAAAQQLGRFRSEADINWQARSAGSVANGPKGDIGDCPDIARFLL